VLHAGGKFDNDSYKVSGGCTASASRRQRAVAGTRPRIWRNGQVFKQKYQRGKPQADLETTGTTKKRGTKITFSPDKEIFETVEFSFDTLAQRPPRAGVPQRGHSHHARRRARNEEP
jgi:DNA gyrase subunit B